MIGRPVEEVFEAWVDPGKMSGYFISDSSGRMEAGRTVSWTWDDYGGMQLDIDVKTVEPGRKLAFDWSVGDAPTRVAVEFEGNPLHPGNRLLANWASSIGARTVRAATTA